MLMFVCSRTYIYIYIIIYIRMDLGEVGWSDVDWIGLAQDRNRWRAPVSAVMNLVGEVSANFFG
jgi:hypothetical protein